MQYAITAIFYNSMLLILNFADVIYYYIFKEQDNLIASILKIFVIIICFIIYKIIRFFILKRNQKSVDCVDENKI